MQMPVSSTVRQGGGAGPVVLARPPGPPKKGRWFGALPVPARRLLLMLAVGSIFMAVYALSNHLTSLRADIGHGVFEWERAVPFVPWTIVPYLSIGLFFVASFLSDGEDAPGLERYVARLLLALAISVLCYAAFPLRFAFERPQTEGLFGWLFGGLSAFDLPYNRAPSLHISVLVILWARLVPATRGLARIALCGWLLLIGLSVFTTWQHHMIDVIAGMAVGGVCIMLTRRPKDLAAQRASPATICRCLRRPTPLPNRTCPACARPCSARSLRVGCSSATRRARC